MKQYKFTVVVNGYGDTLGEAKEDAIESFASLEVDDLDEPEEIEEAG